ncbi:TPA: glycoside hydrolase family protein [Pseudomonas aeruginosa]|nr:glycoside hydrolase family protein [Pseudomonas aeruginosa]
MSNSRNRVLVAALTVSLAGFGAWMKSEDFSAKPYVPTKGDVPTIGYGSTRYENGQSVKLTDPPITRQRGEQLARRLMAKDEQQFRDSLPGVKLFQEEYDLYLDFTGQFGITNWRGSSMRRDLLAGNYRQACDDLLKWRNQAGRDCSLPKNWGPKGCKGVWTRQQERHAQCIAVQVPQ